MFFICFIHILSCIKVNRHTQITDYCKALNAEEMPQFIRFSVVLQQSITVSYL